MKFSDYYLSPASRTLAAICGLLSGLGIGLFTDWKIGILAGCAVALIASVLIPFRVYRADLPCLRLQEQLPKPFLINQRVRFTVQNGAVTGFFILTPEQIVLMTSDRGKRCVAFSRTEIKEIRLGNDTELNIFLNETQFIRVICAFGKEIYQVLQENGWR